MGPVKNRDAFIFFLVPFLFSSCALTLNTKKQQLHIYCNRSVQLVDVENAVRVKNGNSIAYEVPRSKQPITLRFRLPDSSRVNYVLKGRLSPAYYAGNLLPYAFPLGYVVDLFYPNRFRYKPESYFSYDSLDHRLRRKNFVAQEKNYLDVYFGWSGFNVYQKNMFSNYEGNHSMLGLNLQMDYFFKPQHSFFFEAGVSTTPAVRGKYLVWVNNGTDISYVNDRTSNAWYAGGYKYHLGRFGIGAGISISPSAARGREFRVTGRDSTGAVNPDQVESKKTVQQLTKAGVVVNAGYNFGGAVNVGVNWHLFGGDLNKKKGAYASHFFNVYVSFKAFKFRFYKSKQVYEYN